MKTSDETAGGDALDEVSVSPWGPPPEEPARPLDLTDETYLSAADEGSLSAMPDAKSWLLGLRQRFRAGAIQYRDFKRLDRVLHGWRELTPAEFDEGWHLRRLRPMDEWAADFLTLAREGRMREHEDVSNQWLRHLRSEQLRLTYQGADVALASVLPEWTMPVTAELVDMLAAPEHVAIRQGFSGLRMEHFLTAWQEKPFYGRSTETWLYGLQRFAYQATDEERAVLDAYLPDWRTTPTTGYVESLAVTPVDRARVEEWYQETVWGDLFTDVIHGRLADDRDANRRLKSHALHVQLGSDAPGTTRTLDLLLPGWKSTPARTLGRRWAMAAELLRRPRPRAATNRDRCIVHYLQHNVAFAHDPDLGPWVRRTLLEMHVGAAPRLVTDALDPEGEWARWRPGFHDASRLGGIPPTGLRR